MSIIVPNNCVKPLYVQFYFASDQCLPGVLSYCSCPSNENVSSTLPFVLFSLYLPFAHLRCRIVCSWVRNCFRAMSTATMASSRFGGYLGVCAATRATAERKLQLPDDVVDPSAVDLLSSNVIYLLVQGCTPQQGACKLNLFLFPVPHPAHWWGTKLTARP